MPAAAARATARGTDVLIASLTVNAPVKAAIGAVSYMKTILEESGNDLRSSACFLPR